MTRRKITEEFLKEAHDLHLNGMTPRQVGLLLSTDAARLRTAWRNLGWEIHDGRRRTDPNHEFFSVIDSEIKAYLLGFFASDGHIEKRNYDSYTLKWDIHTRDEELLHLINSYIGRETYRVYRLKDREVSGISITSKQIGLDLLSLGYDNHKTHTSRSLPKIDAYLMHHFLRGYFDGDGSISVSPNKKWRGVNRCWSIAACYRDILDEIQALLPQEQTIYYIKEYKKEFGSRLTDSAVLSCHSKTGLSALYEYLYRDATFFLERKHQKFLQAIA